MKTYLNNKDGFVYISLIFILLIISGLLASLTQLINYNNILVKSNNDNYRANYIAESILELKIEELLDLCNGAVDSYLKDFHQYNMQFSGQANNYVFYSLPDFYNYINAIIPYVEGLSQWESNPFAEYKEDHYYEIIIQACLRDNYIHLIASGQYGNARSFIDVVIQLPVLINRGQDENGLPIEDILPAEVVKYYQTFDKINIERCGLS